MNTVIQEMYSVKEHFNNFHSNTTTGFYQCPVDEFTFSIDDQTRIDPLKESSINYFLIFKQIFYCQLFLQNSFPNFVFSSTFFDLILSVQVLR